MKKYFTQNMIFGVLLVAALAAIAYFIAKIPVIEDLGISPLIIGIVLARRAIKIHQVNSNFKV